MKCANGKFKKVNENLGSTKYHRGIFGAMIFHCFDVCERLECVLDVGIKMFCSRYNIFCFVFCKPTKLCNRIIIIGGVQEKGETFKITKILTRTWVVLVLSICVNVR
jgi:hypothetical protein